MKESILHLADSLASVIFDALKESYEYLGTSAKYYVRQDYHNAKIDDYESIGDFITGLTKLAHLINKTVKDTGDCIRDRQIAMRVIHSLPTSMRTLQTLLIETAPSTSEPWNLSTLCQQIVTNERQAQAAGEDLGTKLDVTHESKALAIEDRRNWMR